MGADYLHKLTARLRFVFTISLLVCGLGLIGLIAAVESFFPATNSIKFILFGFVWLALSLTVGWLLARWASKPLRFLAEAILHISPTEHTVAAPPMEQLTLGRELVTMLSRQVYDFVGARAHPEPKQSQSDLLRQMTLPVVGLDGNLNITFANPSAEQYAEQKDTLIGKNIYSGFEMAFASQTNNFDTWLQGCRDSTITSNGKWNRVRLRLPDQVEPKYFDLHASFSKHSPSGTEVILTFFDNTDVYRQEDQAISFIALAVHELRTPLTILRGYIEATAEELGPALTPEMTVFMQRMEASAESLSAFVSNILNVAHVEQDQLSLQLREENWGNLLERVVADMQLRAKVQGMNITLTVAPDVPSVAADNVSIAEVMNNLLDNAIKYSKGKGTQIIVNSTLNNDGLIETTIQDFGVGIPTGVMPSLFEKFARNHRNRATIAGTGLGLYLSKSLVSAHKGNLWVRSKEGEGSIFGFTLLPYARLAEAAANSDTSAITTHPHGWIKNHSMTRH